MKKILLPIIVLMVLSLGCGFIPSINIPTGTGHLVSETRNVSNFSKITLMGAGELIITQGDKESLEIEAEDNIIDYITTEIQGDELVIGFKKDFHYVPIPTKTLSFNIVVNNLEKVEINGAGETHIYNLKTPSLEFEMDGAGSVVIDGIEVQKLKVRINGGGSFDLSGKADEQRVYIDGAGDYDAADLETKVTSVDMNGFGSVVVWADDQLDLDIDGAGSISYYGKPNVTQRMDGAGSIESLGEHH